jgi:hypothetical protein
MRNRPARQVSFDGQDLVLACGEEARLAPGKDAVVPRRAPPLIRNPDSQPSFSVLGSALNPAGNHRQSGLQGYGDALDDIDRPTDLPSATRQTNAIAAEVGLTAPSSGARPQAEQRGYSAIPSRWTRRL